MSRSRKKNPYRKSRRFDASCRSHGGCPYCERNRFHSTRRRILSAQDQLEDFMTDDDIKARRASRLKELKEEFLKVAQTEVPDVREVELSDTAAIELFGMGLLDAPEEEWREFIDGLMDGTMELLDSDTLDEEERRGIEEGLKDIRHGRTL